MKGRKGEDWVLLKTGTRRMKERASMMRRDRGATVKLGSKKRK